VAKEKAVTGKKTVKSPAGRPSVAKTAKSSRKPSAPGRGTKSAAPAKKAASPGKAPVAKRPAKAAKPKAAAKPVKPAATKPVAAKPVVKPVVKIPVSKPAPKSSTAKPASPPLSKASTPPKKPASKGAAVPAKFEGSAEKAKAVVRPARNGRVAGVLQAARSVASRANKVVELQSTRRSHVTTEELSEFRQVLLDKRRELVEDMVNLEGEAKRSGTEGGAASTMPIHMADLGSDTWEQEFTLNLIEKEHTIVREIDEALDRIQNKTYGTCLATGKTISKARLRVKPWAKYCIEYARKRELGLS
jgi:RNA polymerase-binding transcription factor DksA